MMETIPLLIADDADEMRGALVQILSARGYSIIEASNGREAVQMARALQPAAILMDVAMPEVDGITALAELRRDPTTRAIPVAAVTALAMPEDRRRIEAAGFDACLYKPFRVSHLLALLGQLLDRRSEPSPA